MPLLPTLTGTLQDTVEELGVPLPVSSESTVYMLLELEFMHGADGGYTARIPGVAAYGEGETKEEAALALREALRSYIDAFGNEQLA